MKTFASRIRMRGMRLVVAGGLCILAATGCGGGGGGGGGASIPIPAAATGSTPATPAGSTSAAGPNVATISVDAGPAGATGIVNAPYVSVKVCVPGNSASCQTIDHVVIDTGSTGLRLIASALNPSGLTPQTDDSGNPVAECARFVSSYSWGSVRLADVTIAGETASSVPVQIIGDAGLAAVPSSCANAGAANNTVASLGANGLLGLGAFRQDCGSACVGTAIPGTYYICPGDTCSPTAMPLARQITNPVALFPTDNNGVLIQLPAIADTGATNVIGSLVFGIGTRSNNALGSAQVFGVDASGDFTTIFNGHTYLHSFIDSGSNFLFFDSASLPACTGIGETNFYCPATTQSLTAVNQGTNGTNGSVSFNIANADVLFASNRSATAFNDVGGKFPGSTGFDWGLPFFFGRNVFTALEGASTPGGTGPYVAY